MAAYHWEARRRQMQVERRLQQAREAPGGGPRRPQQQQEEALREGNVQGSPPSASRSPPKPARRDAADCSCTCRTAHAPQHSGKLLKRYSTTEYIQQW